MSLNPWRSGRTRMSFTCIMIVEILCDLLDDVQAISQEHLAAVGAVQGCAGEQPLMYCGDKQISCDDTERYSKCRIWS